MTFSLLELGSEQPDLIESALSVFERTHFAFGRLMATGLLASAGTHVDETGCSRLTREPAPGRTVEIPQRVVLGGASSGHDWATGPVLSAPLGGHFLRQWELRNRTRKATPALIAGRASCERWISTESTEQGHVLGVVERTPSAREALWPIMSHGLQARHDLVEDNTTDHRGIVQ